MNPNDPKPGTLIDGRYLLETELGRGGHGLVFRATDQKKSMPVALKILHQSVSEDPQYTVRLWREAQSLAALWGSSVVRVYGFGTDDERGCVYMSMELLEGETLNEYLGSLECFGDKLSAFRMLEMLDPVARALHAAHSKGIIHRDLKPANIIILFPEAGGGTRLMDFGLAKIHGAVDLTQAGMVAGSPSYISPEVWRAKAFDHRIDVYSFAAVIYRSLAGRPPFTGASMVDILMAATAGERPKLSTHRPDLPDGVDAWLTRALAVEPGDRYPYVSSMWNDLIRLIMTGSGPSALLTQRTFSLPPV